MFLPNLKVPVFDLSLVASHLRDYFMDRQGNIYSMKSGNPVKLGRSYTPSGQYFSLNKRSIRQDHLFIAAESHTRFMEETGQTVDALKGVVAQGDLPVSLPGRTKNVREAVTGKGYLLATLNPKDKLVFGTEPMFHLRDTTAKAEAERIATETGAEVVMLKIVGKVKVQKAVWE